MANRVLTFSPPTKPVEAEASVETLLLQPFAKLPQVTFENVAARREAVRLLRVLNTSNMEQVVTLSIPRGKGFTADPEVFKVIPGQHQLVTFSWRPDEKDTATRLSISVTTDKGFRSCLILLGTVRQEARPRINKKPVPKPSVLTSSQKLNLTSGLPELTQSAKKTAPNPSKAPKKATPARITVPVEFKNRSKKHTTCENSACKSVKSTPVVKQASSRSAVSGNRLRSDGQLKSSCPARTAPIVPKNNGCPETDDAETSLAVCLAHKPEELVLETGTVPPEGVRRETFISGINVPETTSHMPEDSHGHVIVDCNHQCLLGTGAARDIDLPNGSGDIKAQADILCKELEMEISMELQTTASASTECCRETANATFEDSLDARTEDLAGRIGDEADPAQNDTFELDLSARMEMLYEQVTREQCSKGAHEIMTNSTSQEQFNMSGYLTSLYNEMCEEKSKELLRSPSLVTQVPEAMMYEHRCSSPKFLDEAGQDNFPEDLVRELELDIN